MEILINDKTIAFELEKTLSLNELLENIQEWAGKDNMFILDYKVNGEPFVEPSQVYNSENIDKLEVLVGTRQSLIWENLGEINSYIQKIYTYLLPRLKESEHISEIDINSLADGLKWILNSYDALKNYFKSEKEEKFTPEFLNSVIENENFVMIIHFLQSISEDITLWKKQVFYNLLDTSEASEIRDLYLSELTTVIDSLEKIASDLTIGKDQDALRSLENIIEWLSIGLMVFEKSGTDSNKIEEVKEALNQLNDALGTKDFVSLADIVDFDLRDSLQEILGV